MMYYILLIGAFVALIGGFLSQTSFSSPGPQATYTQAIYDSSHSESSKRDSGPQSLQPALQPRLRESSGEEDEKEASPNNQSPELKPLEKESISQLSKQKIPEQKRVLIFGAGDKLNNIELWEDYFEQQSNEYLSYQWEAANNYCLNEEVLGLSHFKGCKNLDFNSLEKLQELEKDSYDLILFDWSTFKFADWNYDFFFVIKDKLKLGGQFYLPLELKNGCLPEVILTPINDFRPSAPMMAFATDDDAKKYILMAAKRHQENTIGILTPKFLATSVMPLWKFSLGDENEMHKRKLLSTIREQLNNELNNVHLGFFKEMFGEAVKGKDYFGPKRCNIPTVKEFLILTKTDAGINLTDEEYNQFLSGERFGEKYIAFIGNIKKSYNDLFLVDKIPY